MANRLGPSWLNRRSAVGRADSCGPARSLFGVGGTGQRARAHAGGLHPGGAQSPRLTSCNCEPGKVIR